MARMSRALVMPGDGTWELRELPVPDPPPGGAVLRVEASGMCHSIGGLKDRKPVEGFISDLIPMKQLHLHAGFPGDHVKTAVELIRQGRVPTADLLGEVVTVDGFGDALRMLSRDLPGRDAIRLSLRMTDRDAV